MAVLFVMSRKIAPIIVNSLFAFFCLASADAQNLKNAAKDTRYLALGDSLAFGYNPLVQPPNLSEYVGYPDIVSTLLHLKLANASCPGETSGTLDGSSSVYLPGFDCATLEAEGGLFVPYNGTPNQLAYAVKYLQENPNAKLVTINIGVNDIGVLQAECTAEGAGNAAAIAACEQSGLPGVLNTFGQNLATIFGGLRSTEYTGPIVALNAFAFSYSDPLQVEAFTALNQVIASVSAKFNVAVADTYRTFEAVAAPFGGDDCKAGLLLKLSNGTCDTHPTAAGQALLAATVLGALDGASEKGK